MSFRRIGDYNVIGIKNIEGFGVHFLYVKKHVENKVDQNFPPNKTLFITNIPTIYSEKTIKKIFGKFGKVVSVKFSSKKEVSKNSCIVDKIAHVTFEDPQVLENICEISFQPIIYTIQYKFPTGLQALQAQFDKDHQDPLTLKKDIEKKVAAFDAQEAKRRKLLKKKRNEPDEDGFITVVHGKRRRFLEPEQKVISKKKKRPLEDFNLYAWKAREQKRNQLAEMRLKFEEDKKRIALMRAQRKFKPL